MKAHGSTPTMLYGVVRHFDAKPKNKMQSAGAAFKFMGKFTVSTTWNTAKLAFNMARVTGGTVGAATGALVGTVGGGIYKGIQRIRHKQTRPLSDYVIKASQFGYKAGSCVGGAAAIAAAVIGSPYTGSALLGGAVAAGISSIVYAPVVGYEHCKHGFSMVEDELMYGSGGPNRFIRHQEDRFLNWRKDSESSSSSLEYSSKDEEYGAVCVPVPVDDEMDKFSPAFVDKNEEGSMSESEELPESEGSTPDNELVTSDNSQDYESTEL